MWRVVGIDGQVQRDADGRAKLASQPALFVASISLPQAQQPAQDSNPDVFIYQGRETGDSPRLMRLERAPATGRHTGAIAADTDWPQVCGWPGRARTALGLKRTSQPVAAPSTTGR